MWLSVLALVVGTVAGLATGGRPRWAARVPLRWGGLVVAGVVFEVAAGRWSLGWLGYPVLVGGYVLLLGFACANPKVHGIGIVAAGLLANLVVVVVDAGMPVRLQAA